MHAGDIGAVAKLKDTLTGDTLGDKGLAVGLSAGEAAPSRPSRSPSKPSRATTKTAWATRCTSILEEDQSLRFYRDPQTSEFLLAGTGQQHVEIVVSRAEEALRRGRRP